MKKNSFSFKINFNKDTNPNSTDLKTYRSAGKNSSINLTSRTNITKDNTKLNTRTSSNALSTSRKTSISIFTSRSERNGSQTFRKSSIYKKPQTMINPQILDQGNTTFRHKTSASQQSYQSTNYKTFNTQQSEYNNVFNETPKENGKQNKINSLTKQQSQIKQDSVPSLILAQRQFSQNESFYEQLNIPNLEPREPSDKMKQPNEQELQFEFDVEDVDTPNMQQLRKRLDTQFGYSRDYNQDSTITNKETPKSKKNDSARGQNLNILDEVFSTETNPIEYEDKLIGVELRRFERSLDEKIKQNQMSIQSSFTNEINIYSSLEYQLQKKNLDQQSIDRRLEKVFQKNQDQKKRMESIGSHFLIEYSLREDIPKAKSSAHKTISIIVLDEINEDDTKQDLTPKVDSLIQVNAQPKPKRTSIFLHKNNLNFGQFAENQINLQRLQDQQIQQDQQKQKDQQKVKDKQKQNEQQDYHNILEEYKQNKQKKDKQTHHVNQKSNDSYLKNNNRQQQQQQQDKFKQQNPYLKSQQQQRNNFSSNSYKKPLHKSYTEKQFQDINIKQMSQTLTSREQGCNDQFVASKSLKPPQKFYLIYVLKHFLEYFMKRRFQI